VRRFSHSTSLLLRQSMRYALVAWSTGAAAEGSQNWLAQGLGSAVMCSTLLLPWGPCSHQPVVRWWCVVHT
jgi:hypothetical protein